MAKSMKAGGGGRFQQFVDSLTQKGVSEEKARAIAAAKGNEKYGKSTMQRWSQAGRKRAAKGK